MKKLLWVCMAWIILLSSCARPPMTAAGQWQEQYDLGVRYLSEGNYQEAILAFNAAIEIDPKRADAYVQLADAYMAQGDTEHAEEVLRDALGAVDDLAAIQARLDELLGSDTPADDSSSAPIDDSGLVKDAYRAAGDYTGYVYDHQTGESVNKQAIYSIPLIDLPGDYIETVNSEIYDTLYPIAQDSMDEIAEYGYPMTSGGVSYQWSVNGDILSVVICNLYYPDFSGGEEYFIYNISISEQTEVTKEALLDSVGLTLSEYNDLAGRALYSNAYRSLSMVVENNQSGITFANEILSRTISQTNIDETRPFLDDNGCLNLIGLVYSPAGADAYYHRINLEDYEVFGDYPNLFQ